MVFVQLRNTQIVPLLAVSHSSQICLVCHERIVAAKELALEVQSLALEAYVQAEALSAQQAC